MWTYTRPPSRVSTFAGADVPVPNEVLDTLGDVDDSTIDDALVDVIEAMFVEVERSHGRLGSLELSRETEPH